MSFAESKEQGARSVCLETDFFLKNILAFPNHVLHRKSFTPLSWKVIRIRLINPERGEGGEFRKCRGLLTKDNSPSGLSMDLFHPPRNAHPGPGGWQYLMFVYITSKKYNFTSFGRHHYLVIFPVNNQLSPFCLQP